eukprot:3304496-Pyramimonas_sp.AAC.1
MTIASPKGSHGECRETSWQRPRPQGPGTNRGERPPPPNRRGDRAARGDVGAAASPASSLGGVDRLQGARPRPADLEANPWMCP